jgi:hypothetical protein
MHVALRIVLVSFYYYIFPLLIGILTTIFTFRWAAYGTYDEKVEI